MKDATSDSFFKQVYGLVRQIPPGKVATYGQIAALLGNPRGARAVGWAMRACPKDVPWHRVINSQGRISERGRHPYDVDLQRAMLEAEGVAFEHSGRVDLSIYQWLADKGD